MIKNNKHSDDALQQLKTMPLGENVLAAEASKMQRVQTTQRALEEAPEMAAMVTDIKTIGKTVVIHDASMTKLESTFGDLPSELNMKKVHVMGGLGPLDE